MDGYECAGYYTEPDGQGVIVYIQADECHLHGDLAPLSRCQLHFVFLLLLCYQKLIFISRMLRTAARPVLDINIFF